MGQITMALFPKMEPGRFVVVFIGDVENGKSGKLNLAGKVAINFHEAGFIYIQRVAWIK